MAETPYWKLLKDGRWQELRLVVMQRDDFTCQRCYARGREGATLNVHHKIYRKGKKPWEYPAVNLITLCESCHELDHSLRDHLKEAIAKLNDWQFEELLGYAEAMVANDLTQSYLSASSPDHLKPGWEKVRFPIRSSSHAYGFHVYLSHDSDDEDAINQVGHMEEAGYLEFMQVLDTRWCRGSGE